MIDILELQELETEESADDNASNLSLLLCDRHSSHSTLLCL